MTNLFTDIQTALDTIQHGWTSPEKACTMAGMVLALRPDVSLEIGVYAGKGLISLALAHKAIGRGIAIGIDPYSAAESAKGQIRAEDSKFWGDLNHDAVYSFCTAMISRFGVQNHCKLIRSTSDAYLPPDDIGILRSDGNHGEQALRDVQRFAPRVKQGGYLLLDDLDWAGGAVVKARYWLRGEGWTELYRLDDGLVFRK